MIHYAYTWVQKGYVHSYEEEIDTQGNTYLFGYKWPSGLVFVSAEACESGKRFMPRWEGSPSVEMKRVELSGQINSCAKRDPERAGAWSLAVFAKIVPLDEQPKKKAKKKAKKAKKKARKKQAALPPKQPTLFDED